MNEPLPPQASGPRRQVHVEPDARTTRTTGTNPSHVIADAVTIAAYLRTGEQPPPTAMTGDELLALYDRSWPTSEPRHRWWRRNPDKRAAWTSFAAGNEQEHR